MRDRTAVLIGALAGAVAGSVAGWLWLTDDGRRMRARRAPRLQELAGQEKAQQASARRVQAPAPDSVQTAREVASRSTGR